MSNIVALEKSDCKCVVTSENIGLMLMNPYYHISKTKNY